MKIISNKDDYVEILNSIIINKNLEIFTLTEELKTLKTDENNEDEQQKHANQIHSFDQCDFTS